MARYTDIDALLDLVNELPDGLPYKASVKRVLMQAPEADVVSLPCKVGDEVWTIRSYHHTRYPVKGKVSEIYFSDESMIPCIVVKGTNRGKWGERVFATQEDAETAIRKGRLCEKTSDKNCTTCKHLVPCEPNPFGICEQYEREGDG